MFWFPKTFQIVEPTGIVERESKTLLSRSHGVAPTTWSGVLATGLAVSLTGFDILSTGLPFISKEAKSPEPKLVGHIDASWNLFYTHIISVLVVVASGRFEYSLNKKLKLSGWPLNPRANKRLPDSCPFLKHLIAKDGSSGLVGLSS